MPEPRHRARGADPMNGVGPFLHIDPDDRPAAIFGGLRRRERQRAGCSTSSSQSHI